VEVEAGILVAGGGVVPYLFTAKRTVIGDRAYIGGLGLDISDRKQVARTLAEEATRRRILFEQSRDGIVVVDLEGAVIEANTAFAEMLGYAPDEMQALHVWDWATRPREELLAEFAAIRSRGRTFETRQKRKDGQIIDVETSVCAIETGGRTLLYSVHRDISQRKQADAARAETAMFLRETQAIAHVGGWKANPQTDMLLWTEEVYRLVEHPLDSPPQGLQEGLRYYAPEYLPEIQRLLARTLEHGTPFTFETEMIAGSGRRFWAELRCIGRVESEEGTFITGTFQDISERKQAEQSLRERESVLRAIVSQAGDAIELADLETFRFVEFNDTSCKLLGYTRDEYSKLSVFDIQAEISEHELRARMTSLPTGQAVSFETRHRLKNGGTIDVQVNVRCIELAGHRHAVAIWSDISERKRVAAELDRHRHHLEEIVASRTAALEAANHRLAMSDRRLSAMFAMSQNANTLDERELLQMGIEEAVKLTASEIGYLHFVNEDQQTIALYTWSAGTLQHCTAA
jgi:PAS domain S-box-containing protein